MTTPNHAKYVRKATTLSKIQNSVLKIVQCFLYIPKEVFVLIAKNLAKHALKTIMIVRLVLKKYLTSCRILNAKLLVIICITMIMGFARNVWHLVCLVVLFKNVISVWMNFMLIRIFVTRIVLKICL